MKGLMRRRVWLCAITLGLSGVFSMMSQAVPVSFEVRFTVELKTCDVNNNQTIEVDFEDMIINNIDGVAYERPIPYSVHCDDAVNGTSLNLFFEDNTGANFTAGGYQLLRTDRAGLGLLVKQNGNPFSFNSELPFTYGNEPTLTVVPVKNENVGLDDGKFTASALLTVEYN
ncbi:fimbrial protein [Providencia manganoxydans]|uniref:fimbrial protein n=1 Tax=Providencia manganoxydans TaxID=2923283 RepID=UPI0034E381DA